MGRYVSCAACGERYDSDWFCTRCPLPRGVSQSMFPTTPQPPSKSKRESPANAVDLPARPPGRICGFCREALDDGPLVECDRCGHTLHAPCALELNGCPTLGCVGSLGAPGPTRVPHPATSVEGDGGSGRAKRTTDARLHRRRATQAERLTDRLHSGGLSGERIAVAAYLGNPSAALVVPAWNPSDKLDSWPAAVVLETGPLTRAQRVWFACLCAEHAVKQHWTGGPEPAEVLRLARGWCRGHVDEEELAGALVPGINTRERLASIPFHGQAAADALRSAFYAAQTVLEGRAQGYLALHHAVHAARAGHIASMPQHTTEPAESAEEAERAWQAAAIASALLGTALNELRAD